MCKRSFRCGSDTRALFTIIGEWRGETRLGMCKCDITLKYLTWWYLSTTKIQPGKIRLLHFLALKIEKIINKMSYLLKANKIEIRPNWTCHLHFKNVLDIKEIKYWHTPRISNNKYDLFSDEISRNENGRLNQAS